MDLLGFCLGTLLLAANPAAAGWWLPGRELRFQYQIGKAFDPATDFITGVQVGCVKGLGWMSGALGRITPPIC
jgi:hypothetical protein